MLRLHGFAFSNYHNIVKVVLLEKRVNFEEVTSYPPADDSYLAKNPTGKFPCLELEDGSFLGESKVIVNYLEEVYPQVALLPSDPLKKARARELMDVVDLYLEWPARRLYGEVFSSEGKVSDETREAVRPLLDRGIAGFNKLARFDPYVAGPDLTLADFSVAFHFPAIAIASKAIYGENLLRGVPGVLDHQRLMDERDCVQRVRSDQLVGEKSFMNR